jgi:hypothetical protein
LRSHKLHSWELSGTCRRFNADRATASAMRANQLRLLFPSFAQVLIDAHQR